MNWEMVSAIVAIVALLLTMFVEWPRFNERWRESRTVVKSTLLRVGQLASGLGCLLVLLAVSLEFGFGLPQSDFLADLLGSLGYLFFGVGGVCLFLPSWQEERNRGWTVIAFLTIIAGIIGFVLVQIGVRFHTVGENILRLILP